MTLSRALLIKCGVAFAGAGLAASFIAREEEPQVAALVQPATSDKRAQTRAPASKSAARESGLDIALLNRAPTTELEHNVFAVPTPPAPPPPPSPPRVAVSPPVIAAPPPKPSAPALPFRFLGKMVDRGTTILFLSQGTQNLSVRQGELIGDSYRLEQIDDTSATFVYIPLHEQQTLSTGNRN